jgi:hypothetical protein
MKPTTLVLAGLLAFAPACGKEVGRVPFTGEGTASATVALKAGEVSFWTDIDIEYNGDASLTYEVELTQGGAKVGSATCNALGQHPAKMSWLETNVGDSHTRRGFGKMTCAATVGSGGPTVVTVKLAFDKRPVTVPLKKADLSVKQ